MVKTDMDTIFASHLQIEIPDHPPTAIRLLETLKKQHPMEFIGAEFGEMIKNTIQSKRFPPQTLRNACGWLISHRTWVLELNLKLPNGGEQDFIRVLHGMNTTPREWISSIKVVTKNTKAISLYSLTNLAQMFGDEFCFRRSQRIERQKAWLAVTQWRQDRKAAEHAKAAESGQAVPAETGDTIDQEIELAMNMPDFGLAIEYKAPGPSPTYAADNLDELLKGVQLRGEKFARDGVTNGRVIARELFEWVVGVETNDGYADGRRLVKQCWEKRLGHPPRRDDFEILFRY